MSFLKKILGKDEPVDSGPPPECTHGSLVAHWDQPADMGNENLASSWKCTSCDEEFSSDEREVIRAAEEERVRHYQEEKAALDAEIEAGTRVV